MNEGVPATPRPASTVLLLREQSAALEVFLLRRHRKSVFMAGNYVYPGGAVDKGDEEGAKFNRDEARPSGARSEAFCRDLLEYRIAAIRELFEEAGVLLAYRKNETLFRPVDMPEREKFAGYRKELNLKQITFLQILWQENLTPAFDSLFYYTHWITPEAQPIRFDTRFFVALHPQGQDASPDQKETDDGIWIAPRLALEANVAGSIPLSPPTLKTLEELSRYGTVKSFLESLRSTRKGLPVLPVLKKIAGEPVLIFPWDPDYERCKKSALPENFVEVCHGRPSCPADDTTRVVHRRGVWLPFVKDPGCS
jgi:8-oxo-dGTP pyrophosphatase MutT (NUDIX family)